MLKTKGKPCIPDQLPLNEIDWEPLIPYIARSNRAIATYEGILFAVPDPQILLSPLRTREAVLSSKIEGTQATLGEVLRFEAGEVPERETARQDIGEIINYRNALERATTVLERKPFHLNLVLELHAILLDSVRGRDKGRGRFRTVQNWIGRPGSAIEEADYVPPAPEQVRAFMENWETYYHAKAPDVLVQLAVIHAQFEIIHPFLDGNGRLGRILIPLFLFEKGILTRPIFYLSSYLEDHREEYIERLRNIGDTADSWNQWIIFFITAIIEQADENSSKVCAITELYDRLKAEVMKLTRSQYAVPLLDLLFKHPIFNSSDLKTSHMPSTPMILNMLSKLESNGIITVLQKGSGRRPSLFSFDELLNICESRKIR